jgi:F-type H+-transporting ATPase subunit alpha
VPVEEQIVVIYLGSEGYMDSVPVGDVRRFEKELLEHLRRSDDDVLGEVRSTKVLDDDNIERLVRQVNDFKSQFTASDGSSVVVNEAEAETMDPDEVGQEQVSVTKPRPAGK